MAYFEQTNLTNERGQVINPSTDESITLLRRIVKLLESTAATDPQQRQRMVVDAALPTGANTIGTVNIASAQTLATVTTVATVTSVTSVANLAGMNGWNQQMFNDPARTAYNTGIRRWISFT